jgi:mono/diheme cytochrome c family protein
VFALNSSARLAALLVLLGLVACSQPLPGEELYGELSVVVAGTTSDLLAVVSAHNIDKDIAYTVYVIDGEYRAVKLIPGNYEISIRPAIEQLESFTEQTATRVVASGSRVRVNFEITDIKVLTNYVGGIEYPDAEIAPYDEIYPPGPGRDALERTCHGCHTVQFFAYNKPRAYSGGREAKDREAWAVAVDRKHKGAAFGRVGKASMFDPAYLPEADRDLLVDYLADNFPADGKARVYSIRRRLRRRCSSSTFTGSQPAERVRGHRRIRLISIATEISGSRIPDAAWYRWTRVRATSLPTVVMVVGTESPSIKRMALFGIPDDRMSSATWIRIPASSTTGSSETTRRWGASRKLSIQRVIYGYRC